MAAQPSPPPDDAGHHKERSQRRVRVKLHAEEHRAEEEAARDASPPGVDAIAARQQDGQGVQSVGGNLHDFVHGIDSARSEVYCTTLPSSAGTLSNVNRWPGPKISKSALRIWPSLWPV